MKHKLMNDIRRIIETKSKQVTIFCPIDDAYDKIYETEDFDEKKLLLNHIAFKHDENGLMYDTLSGGKITLNPKEKTSSKVRSL